MRRLVFALHRFAACGAIAWSAANAWGQVAPPVSANPATGWQSTSDSAPPGNRYAMSPGTAPAPAAASAAVGAPGSGPPAAPQNPPVTRAQVTQGSGTLPNDHGQLWREYDITPYTLRVQNAPHPEQAIVDWILRETGYETWHSTPVGLLSADRRTLRVYHTPQMHEIVADIVDRFVNAQAGNHGFGLRILTIKNPNWRVRALPLMTSIPVQSPGVQGWILAREDAALLMAELRQRTDYREHNLPHQMVLNGQTAALASMRPRSYAKGLVRTQNVWPGFQIEPGQIDEGFSMEFIPLLSTDLRTTEAVVKLRLTQIEKMLPLQLSTPSPVAPNQQAQLEVPQMTMLQVQERFRWPTDQVLLLSMGVVATPTPDRPSSWTDLLPVPVPTSAPRADALLMIESRGPASFAPGVATPPNQTATRPPETFHGRY
jgi:hypothetical protein